MEAARELTSNTFPVASEGRYRALFESSPLATWVCDPTTHHFLEVNDAAVTQYGYTRAEFADLTLEEIEAGLDSSRPPPAMSPSTSWLEPRRWRHRRKDGTMIVVEVEAHDFNLDGRPARLMHVLDVTERVRVEQMLRATEGQLRQAQKMEAIGRLAGGVAHDFNNLLTVVLSYTTLLLDDLEGDHPLRADIAEIQRAGERGRDLASQLLLFSRPHDPTRPAVAIDPWRAVQGLERLIGRLLGDDIDLRLRGSNAAGMVVLGPGQLEQLVMNLVVNARDAMPHGGKLTIEVRSAFLDDAYAANHLGARPGHYVLAAVTDTGTGMTDEVKARAFEPFFTTKEKGIGTGLGLSTVFAIANQHGGHVRFTSELGEGTTFHVYLPRAEAGVTARTASQIPLPDLEHGSETILLVEDDPQVRAATASVLRRCGYTVLDVSNAGEALLTCEQHDAPIHLLLTDVVLPRLGGRQLATRLIAVKPGMKVLFMSGYAGGAVQRTDMLEAEVPFLQKPFTSGVLSGKVREVLGVARS